MLVVQNEYGLLNIGLPAIEGAAFLPHGVELLLDWGGQLYVLGVKTRRLGLVARGTQFVLRTPEFRVSFAGWD